MTKTKPILEPSTLSTLSHDYNDGDYSKFIAGILIEIINDKVIPDLNPKGEE